MSTTNPEGSFSGPVTIVRKAGLWLTVMGVVFVVLGMLAIVEPAVAGLAVSILVGWVLIFGGVAHGIAAFGGGARRALWQLVVATFYIVAGLYSDAPAARPRDAHAVPGRGPAGGSGDRNRRLLRGRPGRRVGLAPRERYRDVVARRHDLEKLAVEFGVGDWDAGRRESDDYRILTTDARNRGSKARRGGMRSGSSAAIMASAMNSPYRWTDQPRRRTSSS